MIIARNKEIDTILECTKSDRSEFIAVYGRRRVGKTFLVKEVLNNTFTFQYTGIANVGTKEQLAGFQDSLNAYGANIDKKLKNWFEAFNALADLVKSSNTKEKKVIFIDELPWMDTHKSNFIPAFEHFWNGFASFRNDIVLIVCGSATSWIIKKVINNHGGLHNRVTHQIYLRQFTLGECEELASYYGLELSRRDILNYYMILGGIPYYWSLLKRGLSQPQNIDNLCFSQGGELVGEFNKLYASLFKLSEPYMQIVTALSKKRKGLTRKEIVQATKINDGGKLTKYLQELEQCDFIRRYTMLGNVKKEATYQLIDSFTLFYLNFMKSQTVSSGSFWMKFLGKPKYNTWSGLAFERVCLLHARQILQRLGISGILTSIHSWHTKGDDNEAGAQIDMLIDREDGVIDICEMKYSNSEYIIDKKTDQDLRHKVSVLQHATNTRKAVHLVMVTPYGLADSIYKNVVQNVITAKDLFSK